MNKPIVMSYSGGKDSSLALYHLLRDPDWEVKRLLTTANSVYQRSSMHGVRTELFEQQASSIGLPLDVVWLAPEDGGDGYQRKMKTALEHYKANGLEHIAFGDLYLEDVRAYRETMNETIGLHSVFPVWGIPTKEFARKFIELGFKAIVVCVDTTQLDACFCGREYDEKFLEDLPEGIDWCAEQGEFHTFCYDGPIFAHSVPFEKGTQTLRENRFQYIDLLPI
ncbi:diphthine--ammonia ligase [Alicyclobacillus curvatus]|nr:diphthine--ammonia ligase [Alicyclobacillus curvatus]